MTDHATKLLQLMDAIRAIPPGPPKVREWVNRYGARWRLIDGRLDYMGGPFKCWIKSGFDSVEAMLRSGRRYGIREVTKGNQ